MTWSLKAGLLTVFMTSGVPASATSVLQRMQAERIEQLGAEGALSEDGWLLRQLLVDASSPYSDSVARPRFTNEAWWRDVLDDTPGAAAEDTLLAQLRLETGVTRARPGTDVMPGAGFRDPFVAAHATKAGLDPDIFWHVLDMAGHARARHFASLAMGLQILRDAIAEVPVERQTTAGVYPDVLRRVMSATQPDHLTAHDIRYLDMLVQHRLLHPGRESTLPMAWRIARVAAAFRDTQGYVTGPPCSPDATPHPRNAGTGMAGDTRPPCLVAATDRAVHRWYVNDLRQPSVRPSGHHGMEGLGALVAALLPLLDMMAIVEVVEAAIADDLVTSEAASVSEAERFSERATRLTCHITE